MDDAEEERAMEWRRERAISLMRRKERFVLEARNVPGEPSLQELSFVDPESKRQLFVGVCMRYSEIPVFITWVSPLPSDVLANFRAPDIKRVGQ